MHACARGYKRRAARVARLGEAPDRQAAGRRVVHKQTKDARRQPPRSNRYLSISIGINRPMSMP
eukprot:502734-Prymnesium_polylepis.1